MQQWRHLDGLDGDGGKMVQSDWGQGTLRNGIGKRGDGRLGNMVAIHMNSKESRNQCHRKNMNGIENFTISTM